MYTCLDASLLLGFCLSTDVSNVDPTFLLLPAPSEPESLRLCILLSNIPDLAIFFLFFCKQNPFSIHFCMRFSMVGLLLVNGGEIMQFTYIDKG